MLSSHITALRAKHARIEDRLRDELTRPAPDIVQVRQLKKQKLILKQEIAAS